MGFSRSIKSSAVVLALVALGTSGALANCLAPATGFAIFQCADVAYFNPPPVPVGFDPNNRPTNVTASFWQLGFGNNEPGKCVNTASGLTCTTSTGCSCSTGTVNRTCNTASLPSPDLFCNGNSGLGTNGTGNLDPTNFNGNDQGVTNVDIKDARVGTAQPGLPPGSLCLSLNNWINSGVDGCADNVRTTTLLTADDDLLNPYYDIYQSRNYLRKGLYSLAWQQDYPLAVLMRTAPDARYFAVAAVASLNRGTTHDGQNGPCASPPGNNPAPCDLRSGVFTLSDVANGLANPVSVGKFNVVPWQQIPKPSANCIANCAGSPRTIRFDWTPAVWYHDRSIRPSANPAIAPADPTRAAGVGVLDLLTKTDPNNFWRGLIRYDLESATATAANLDPNGRLIPASLVFSTAVPNVPQPPVDPNTGNPTANLISATTTAGPDTCWRLRVKFGKKPEALTTTTANCRLGKCGDRGFDVASTDGAVITCVGGALFAEAFTNTSAARSKGEVVIGWTTSAELSVQGYNVYAVNIKGAESQLNSALIPCSECGTGLSSQYQASFPMTRLKGAKGIIVEAIAINNFRSPLTPIR